MTDPNRRPSRRLFWVALIVFDLAVFAAGYAVYRAFRLPDGIELNRVAWEATYRERQLPVPPGGPREGYWGEKLEPYRLQTQFGPLVCDAVAPGRYAYDAMGRQVIEAAADAPASRLLIMGGSVAGGAYASDLAHTYFSRLGELLGQAGHPVSITVWGAGGWTTANEVPAMEWLVEREAFDVVLFLDGLNDLTEARDLPLARRLETSLENLQQARDFLHAHGVPLVIAPQPYLPDKPVKTRLERRILRLHEFDEHHRFAFEGLRVGLAELAAVDGVHLIDCTQVLNAETVTTFADLWHFSDRGHELLARHLAAALAPLLADD